MGSIWGKVVKWKVVVGLLLIFVGLNNLVSRPRGPFQASNLDQQQGMEAMAIVLAVVGVWLVYSGTKLEWTPFLRQPVNP